MKTKRKILLSSVTFLLAIAIALTTFVSVMLGRVNYISLDNLKANGEYTDIFHTYESGTGSNNYEEITSIGEVKIGEGAVLSDKDVQNILLVGDDSAKTGQIGRSDTMILVSIDRRHNQIKMTSLMRDTYVAIPGKGSNRINASYNSGGIKLAKETIEKNFKVKIDNYVRVGFNSFESIINKMGGIEVYLTPKQAAYMTKYGVSNFPHKGTYRMGGADALQYVRMRQMDDDFRRTSRQREVLEQLMKKISRYNAVDLTKLMYDVMDLIHSDITQPEWLGLISEVPNFAQYDIRQFSIPAKDTWKGVSINKMDVLQTDIPENARQLGEFIYTADFDPDNP